MMRDDSEILKAAFPDYGFSLQTTSDPSQFYTLKKEDVAVFISYYPKDEIDEEMYLASYSGTQKDTIELGFEYTSIADTIKDIKKKINGSELQQHSDRGV